MTDNDARSTADASASVRDAVRSLDTRLDDVRREQSWRGIERAIEERPALAAPPRTWRLPVFALATIAVILALVVLPKPTRDGTKTASNGATPSNATPSHATPSNATPSNATPSNATPSNATPSNATPSNATPSNATPSNATPSNATPSNATPSIAEPPTTLSASAGQRTVFDRDGVTITLVGPGVATIHRETDLVRVSVTKGLVVADRTTTAPALAVDAGENHVVSRDARFAVRVEPTMVVLGAGEQAKQIVERHAIDMGALPLVESPTAPPTVDPTPKATPTPRVVAADPVETRERRAPVLPELKMDAAELYKRAEAALAVRDPFGARDFLERLLAEYPADRRADAARYDLALIARANGERKRARELLDTLIASGTDKNLVAAAKRLRPSLDR